MNLFITFLANYLYLFIVASTLCILLLANKNDRRKLICLAAIALPIAFIIGKTLNHFIFNPRPFVVEKVQPLISHAANNGFPSDHTLFSMVIAGIIFVYYRRLGILLIFLAFFVGLGRILAKVHHPVDIIASTVIAAIAVYLAWWILNRSTFTAKDRKA